MACTTYWLQQGVTYGWQDARSSNIYGPYEEKKVMHQEVPIRMAFTGRLVDTPGGEEWFIHFQDKGVYGRMPTCSLFSGRMVGLLLE